MAKVKYSSGIDYVSGALSKPGKSGQHSCSKMLLATHRTAATTNNHCNRIYLREVTERKTPISAREMAARSRFSAVAAMVKARQNDLMHVTEDQETFLAQRNQPNGIRTLKAWYWKVCGDEYDAQH